MTKTRPKTGTAQPIPKLLEVTITAEVLANATRKDSGHCAASDAVNAAIPGARCQTDLQTMTLTLRDQGIRVAYLTPPVVQQLLVDFDNGVELTPTRFALRRADAIQVRAYRPRTPVTGEQSGSRAVPGARAAKPGKRKTVKAGTTYEIPAGASRIPPVGTLANRKGRSRKYGLRQLEQQRRASGREQ